MSQAGPDRSRLRPWYHPRTIVGAWGRGRYPQDEKVRRAAGGIAKLGGLTLVAYIAVKALAGALDRQPAQITAAIKDEADERRIQHTELRADLQELTRAVRDARSGEDSFRAEMRGLAAGRYKCPPPTIIRVPGPTVVVERPTPPQRCDDPPPPAAPHAAPAHDPGPNSGDFRRSIRER